MRLIPYGLAAAALACTVASAQVVPSRASSAVHDLDDAGAAFHAYVAATYPTNLSLVTGAKAVADAADTMHTTIHDVNNSNAPLSQIPCDHNALYRAVTRMPALDTVRNDPLVNRGWRDITRLFRQMTQSLLRANLSYILPSVPAHDLDDTATALDAYLQANYTGAQYATLLAAAAAFQTEADSFHDFYYDLENCRNNRTVSEIPAEYGRLVNAAVALGNELLQSGVWAKDATARSDALLAAVLVLKTGAKLRAYRHL